MIDENIYDRNKIKLSNFKLKATNELLFQPLT